MVHPSSAAPARSGGTGTSSPAAGAVLLLGPTASGKTDLAMRLAEHVDAEIVSVDSALVYRGMDIGTAKPDAGQRAAVPHHLIDILEPTEAYSAAAFAVDARRLIAGIRARGRLPLLVGGTMLYARALLDGFDELPAADRGIRARLEAEAAQAGWPALHARLRQVDPVTAARLEPADAQRIQRALEVFELAGRPMSALLTRRAARGAARGPADAGFDAVDAGRDPSPSEPLIIALEPSDRARLHRRIEGRFEAMLAAGFLDEVARLRARGDLHPGLPSMRCVGYRQAWAFLEGECDRATMIARATAATRQLAKRQLTWLRAMPQRRVVDCLAPDAARTVRELVARVAGEAR